MTNTENALVKKSERNYGIDILKIVSMFMVTLLHFVNNEGFELTPDSGAFFYILTIFLSICYAAVDIFALISGYVMYGKNIKYKRIVNLWFQVAFYSIGLSVIEKLLFKKTSIGYLVAFFFPILTDKYWYFTAYFCMFFFIPLFNRIVEKFSGKSMFKFIAIGFVIFCVFSNIQKLSTIEDHLGLKNGYTVLWISFCYITGAFIKKYRQYFFKISNKVYFLSIFICFALTYINYALLYNIKIPFFNKAPLHDFLLSYTSPTIFISSVCMLLLFSQIKIKHGKNIVKILSATSFSVYIVQVHPLILNKFICKYTTFFNASSAFGTTLLILAGSLALYISVSIVDYLRIKLFKLLHIDSLSTLICKLFEKIIQAIKKRFVKYIGI